jgi:hypothetical protein
VSSYFKGIKQAQQAQQAQQARLFFAIPTLAIRVTTINRRRKER